MEQITTYRVSGKSTGIVFLFHYDLNGFLKGFKLEEKHLTEQQEAWLFAPNHFPSNEAKMKFWAKSEDFTQKFDVEIAPADISFEAIWKLWDLKLKREHSEKAWNKLTDSDKIKTFLNHKPYQNHLTKTGQAKAHLVTWLNQKRYNDEY